MVRCRDRSSFGPSCVRMTMVMSGRRLTGSSFILIYTAVRRIKEQDGEQAAVAPTVVMINFSLGDSNRPFARSLSPLARLLDYLAYRYRILFLVSAGNVRDSLTVPQYQTFTEFEDAAPEAREEAVLNALNAAKSQRTIFSPAEAINVLTVGASHSGSAFNGTLPANAVTRSQPRSCPMWFRQWVWDTEKWSSRKFF